MADVDGMDRAGAVSVDVYPDGRQFGRRLRTEVLPEAQRVGREIAQTISAPISDRITASVREGISADPSARARAVRTGTEIGRDIGRAVTAEVRRAFASLPKAKLDADISGIERKLAIVERRMTMMRTRKDIVIGANITEASRNLGLIEGRVALLGRARPTIQVDAEAAGAFAELEAIDAAVDRLDGREIDISVDVDIGGSIDELFALEAVIEALDGRDIDIGVDVDTGAAVAQMAALNAATHMGRGGISSLIVAAALIAPVIVPAAAAAAGALMLIGPAALAGAAGIGVMIFGLIGVAGAVQAMSAAEDQAAQSAATMAGQQAAVAAAADQVRGAEASLANTRAQAADGARRAAQAVADAQRDLTRAEREALDVRRELSEAQEDARRAIEDLNASVESNALSQRQANLDVAAAKAERDKILADPRATQAQREQAQITYEREVLQLEDLKRRGQRLAADAATANRAGVNGSEEVRAARDRIAQADERVIAARRRVSEAQRAADAQARQSAFQIAQAQQALASAHRAAGQAAIRASVGGTSAMTKLQQAMAALSPEGRRFARFIFGLRDEFGQLRRAAEAGLLPGIEAGLRALLPYWPQIIRFVRMVAGALGEMFEAGLKALTSPFWRQFFGEIADIAVPALRDMFAIAGNVARAVAGMILAFLPLGESVGGGLREMTARWAEWAAGLRDNAGFQKFLDYIREVGPVVLSTIGALVRAVIRIVQASAPIGGVVLVALRGVGNAIASIPVNVLTTMIGVVLGVVAAIKIWIVVQTALNVIMALNPVGIVILAIIALVAVIVVAWRHSETFRNVVMATWQGIQTAALWAWQNVLKPTFDALVVAYGVVADAAVWLWRRVLQPAFEGIAAVVSWWWNNITAPILSGFRFWLREVIGPVVMFFWRNIIQPAWQGIQLAITLAWKAVELIFKAIQVYIRVYLAPIFTWLYRNIIKPAFDNFVAGVRTAWRIVQPIFEMLGSFIKTKVVPAFQAGVTAVGKAWEKIRDIAKLPVKFVIQTVINEGIIAGFNWIASKVGVDPIKPVKLPAGFARGTARIGRQALASGGTLGVLPGYSPGVDIHRFYSASGGALDLSGGEAVMRPEFSAALGVSRIDAANLAARTRGVTGVRDWLLKLLDEIGGDTSSPAAGYVRNPKPGGLAFARGGIVPGYLGAFDWGGIIGKVKSAWNAFTDPVGTLKEVALKAVGSVPGVGVFKNMAIGAAKKILDGAVAWLGSKVMGAGGEYHGPISSDVAAVQTFIRAQAGKPYVWAAAGPRGYDCSGMQSAAYNLLHGRQPYRHTFSTHVMNRFFDPGRGVYTVGYAHAGERGGGSVGHTAGNLAGLPFESRGGDGVVVGRGATPVQSFARIAHMPGLWKGGIIPLGVYDGGGYLPQGLSLAANYTRGDERMAVFTQRQEADLRALAAAARPGSATALGSRAALTIEHYHEAGNDPDEVAADLDWRMRGGGG